MQKDRKEHHCTHVNMKNGRCTIHGKQPFSCDFELIRTAIFSDPRTPNVLGQRLFGRGWCMLRVDSERGALCEMIQPCEETRKDAVRKLKRLQEWCLHFGVISWLPEIIHDIELGLLKNKPLLYTTPTHEGFDL